MTDFPWFQIALISAVLALVAMQAYRTFARAPGSPITVRIISPGDARGWIGLGCYALVILVLGMIGWSDKELLNNDFFKVLATAIVLTGWNNGPVGWAYQATKGGGEAAESNARIAEDATRSAGNGTGNGASGTKADPLHTLVDNPEKAPANVAEKGKKS